MRNVAGCHLAGACPYEVLDISPWAEATKDLFLRNPIAQRLPRKFKINFSGCATDCGQAMFNDVGVIAVDPPAARRHRRARLPGVHRRRPRRQPAPGAWRSRSSPPREDLLATIEAILRVFDHHGNRDNKLRARMKWLVDTMGIDELRERILKERKFLLALGHLPGRHPRDRRGAGRRARRHGHRGHRRRWAHRPVHPVAVRGPHDPYQQWDTANVVRGRANGTVSAYAYVPPRRHHRRPVPRPRRRSSATSASRSASPTARTSCSAASPRTSSPSCTPGSPRIGMAEAGAELARDVVVCPGADTCNLAVTQSRGLAADIGDALEEAGLAEVGGVRINISGCTNSCGQHHIADIGFLGLERRAHGASAPGYQMLLGGHVGNMDDRVRREGRQAAGQARVGGGRAGRRAVRRRARRRRDVLVVARPRGRRRGGRQTLVDLDEFPTPEEAPDFYVDFDETGPYVAEIGDSECAT